MIDSEPASFQSPKKGGAAESHHSLSYIPVYSSDEEDDSRDRQSHWKRIKTRSDDGHTNSSGRRLIKWTDPRDHQEVSPVRRPLQALRGRIPSPKKSVARNNPPGHRMIVLKSRVHEGGHDVAHGGTNKDIDAAAQASKRKFESDHGMISMNIDMYESGRTMARRHMPVERTGYEVRVREEGEYYDDGDTSLFFEDSHLSRPKITVDLREALNRRTRGGVSSRENIDDDEEGFASNSKVDVKVRLRRVDFDLSFKGAATAAPPPESRKKILPLHPSAADRFPRLASAASVLGGNSKGMSERDSEAERRRERWAEKERDFERDLQEEMQKQEVQKQQQQQQQQQQLQQLQTMATKPKSVPVLDYSHKFTVAKAPLGVPVKPVESDPHRLCQRQKQIDYGKNTLGYERYTEMVPRYQRTKAHPRTPDIRQVCSKRSWDGQIRKWRRLLHEYDPPREDDDEDPDQMFVSTREHDGIRQSAVSDDCMLDVQSELVDAGLKIYDGWSDEEC